MTHAPFPTIITAAHVPSLDRVLIATQLHAYSDHQPAYRVAYVDADGQTDQGRYFYTRAELNECVREDLLQYAANTAKTDEPDAEPPNPDAQQSTPQLSDGPGPDAKPR